MLRWALFATLTAILPVQLIAADEPFLKSADYIGPPKPLHAVTNRAFQGIPSMAVSPGGRLWATWYAGRTPGEDHNNYIVLTTSGDNGSTWHETLVVDPDEDGPVRAYDPELWMAPDGNLRLAWAQAVGHEGTVAGVWFLAITNPDSEQPKYDQPERITDGIMMCKPLVLSSGEWVLPASTWRKTDRSARLVVSDNSGKSWKVRGACNVPKDVRAFDEHMLIERRDGSLWLLARTRYGIGQSVSTDRGRTWPDLTPSNIPHPSARFFIRRLNSGNLLLVKHGSMDQRTGRSHLTAFVSSDDGHTWKGGLLLDERGGVSYPDGQQTDDGLIRIIYDYSRTGDRNILMATFREEDAAAGKQMSGSVRLRQVVSQASGGQEKPRRLPPDAKARSNADGHKFTKSSPGSFGSSDFETAPFVTGVKLFSDRRYTLLERPDVLDGMHFVRVPIDGSKLLKCKKTGTVWFLSPAPDRNGDSQTQSLADQGFRKVAVPEIRLFDPSSGANLCTLYQNDCSAGDTIRIGKWAVPLFLP